MILYTIESNFALLETRLDHYLTSKSPLSKPVSSAPTLGVVCQYESATHQGRIQDILDPAVLGTTLKQMG